MRRYTQMKIKGWQGGVQRASCDRFNDEITHHGRKNLIQILPTSTGTAWKVVQQRLYGICRKHNLIENVLVVLLPLLHWEQTELLHLCEVCQLPLSRQEDAPEGHFTRSENYRLPTSFPRKTLYNSRCLSRASSILKESSLWTAALWKVLQVLQHENKQTQKQFFIPQPLLTQLQAPELDTPTLQCLVLAKQYE